MELRHLRYFVAVAEVQNLTKAAAQLRVAQPALGRQVQDLEDELGVDLLRRSPRGVTLTAEGKLFLEEVREILKRTEESVEKVRALARGEYGELHIGYAPSPSVELLPPALAAFKKAAPRVRIVLHDLGSDELMVRLQDGTLELAITVANAEEAIKGIEFEELLRYSFCLAMSAGHPFTRKKSISLTEVATQPLVGLIRREYTEYYRHLDRMFSEAKVRPRIAVECDGSTSMLTELEGGNNVAIVSELFKQVAGKRLLYRPLAGVTEFHSVGIARATKGDVTPAGEKFCEMLRQAAKNLRAVKTKGK
ncbi:MAG TPA: LysR family transcriptional regulator [Verrucomicrobiae bacterium]